MLGCAGDYQGSDTPELEKFPRAAIIEKVWTFRSIRLSWCGNGNQKSLFSVNPCRTLRMCFIWYFLPGFFTTIIRRAISVAPC